MFLICSELKKKYIGVDELNGNLFSVTRRYFELSNKPRVGVEGEHFPIYFLISLKSSK